MAENLQQPDTDTPLVRFLKVASGLHEREAMGKNNARFMMNYDRNAGGPLQKSQMGQAERVSDAVPRGDK